MKHFTLLILLIILSSWQAEAASSLTEKLNQFYSDPATFLNTLHTTEEDGRKFSHREIINKSYIDAKNSTRSKGIHSSDPSGVGYNDRVESLFSGESLMSTLQEMEELIKRSRR